MIWKSIEGTNDIYEVSDTGIVRSRDMKALTPTKLPCIRRGKTLKPWKDKKGYLHVEIKLSNGKRLTSTVHRLVAKTFIPNSNNYPQINHIDCNKENNSVDNLEWCTNEHNHRHAVEHGVYYMGTKHRNSKLTEEQVKDIKKNCKRRSKDFGLMAYARKYNVCQGTIEQILNGKSYRFITVD